MATCERCGFKCPPNPLKILMGTVDAVILLLFLEVVVTPPGFWSNFTWWCWWFSAVRAGLGALLFLISATVWISDPSGYKYSWQSK